MKYKAPVGVVGYADKKELRKSLESGSSYNTIGLDHPDCWEDEPPYEWLVALCAVDDMSEHDAQVIERIRDKWMNIFVTTNDAYTQDEIIDALNHEIDQLRQKV